MAAVKLAIERYGIPQRFLSDNGRAFNPNRMGQRGKLEMWLRSLGVIPMTGLPGRPTTQGKNERVHQTLQRFLTKQQPVFSLEELQVQLDVFDEYYNHHRTHQALISVDGLRMTPAAAWEATPVADEPIGVSHVAHSSEVFERVVSSRGQFNIGGAVLQLRQEHRYKKVLVVLNVPFTCEVFDLQGNSLRKIHAPIPGEWIGVKHTCHKSAICDGT